MLQCLESHGLPIPNWMQSTMIKEAINLLANWQFFYWVGGAGDIKRAQIVGGHLLRVILERMQNGSHATPKVFLYSGVSKKIVILALTLLTTEYKY